MRVPLDKHSKFVGVADEVTVGLLDRRSVLVALIADRGTLWLLIEGTEFDLLDPSTTIERRSTAPFVRRFCATQGRSKSVELVFWAPVAAELRDWPPAGDITHFVAELVASEEELLRAMIRWSATAAGEDVLSAEATQRLEERYQALRRRETRERS
jgi:hypothetical protein